MSLIFVHGAFQSAWVWEKKLPRVRAQKYDVFCPNLAGFGKRQSDLTPHIGLKDPIKDICDVIDHKRLSDVILIGHSYGGIVISGVAKLRPNHICKQ